MIIEHENDNDYEKIQENYEKLIKPEVATATHRLLICYTDDMIETIKFLKTLRKKTKSKFLVHVLIAPNKLKHAKEYRHVFI
jgi:hypothetical protein